ncbi:MAG TPA: hypothetical protein VNT99_14680 [Methylomirabilota bacterium]|nr:hypothetical protein [Methylomirabilota bacterium]
MRSVTLATFNDRDHADPVVNRLQQAGFHPQLRDETKWQKHRFAEALASVKVCVDENEYDSAKQQLKEWDATEHWLDQAVCCPECGSAEVDYPQVTRKFILPSLHILFYRLGLEEKQFYCHTCQHTWPLRIKIEPERDALNWPIKNSPLHENKDTTP